MTEIVFFEKPGCIGNAKQKRVLAGLGHRLDVRNLLAEPWTAERLRGFFGERPVAAWLNPSAPRVRDGDIDVAALDADDALALMLAEPLLIRRPLIETPFGRCAGFVRHPVLERLGVRFDEDLDSCALRSDEPSCDALAAEHRSDPGRRSGDGAEPDAAGPAEVAAQ